MNEQERADLERLKEQQARLQRELTSLSAQLVLLERRLEKPAPEPAKAAPVEPISFFKRPATELSAPAAQPVPRPATTPVKPPPIPPMPQAPPVLAQTAPTSARPVEPAPSGFRSGGASRSPVPVTQPVTQVEAAPARVAKTVSEPAKPTTPTQAASFEMRLGTYWFVRIGIVMVLTGLVFFGNLAYHKYIINLGPGGKISLLYLASALLLGAGWWWQRKAVKESLRNYAQVLFAGGLAATYFTTYAAYHIQPLQVITALVLDGVLLLACAGSMVWFADRQKSEVLAFFAVGLAYYTSIITRVGLFTLYSNLLLTIAAVVFLVRNRWAVLSFASLFATYASYFFWRFLYSHRFIWPSAEDPLWTGICFLMAYWVVFTSAVFLSKDAKFSGPNRATFLTLNNASFFLLFVLTMWQVRTGKFWLFSLSCGTVLLVMSELARRFLAAEPLAKNFYLTQGLLLVTVGFIAKFADAELDLALVLTVESVTLLMLRSLRQSTVLSVASWITAALAVAWAIDGMRQDEKRGLWLGAGLGVLMLWNALWAHRHEPAVPQKPLRAQPAYFTGLACLVWLVATWDNASREQFPLFLAGEGLLLMCSIYVLRMGEATMFGGLLVFVSQLVWATLALDYRLTLPWWNVVLMTLISLASAYWWTQQKRLDLRSQNDPLWQTVDAGPVFGKNFLLFAAAGNAVLACVGKGLHQVLPLTPTAFWLSVGLGAVFMADTLVAHWRTRQSASPVRFQPAYSTALALVVWLAVTWRQTSPENFPLVLAGEGVALTLSIYLLRVREVSLLSQSYIILAQVAWLLNSLLDGNRPPWWNPVLLLGMVLFLSHWWQRQALKAERGCLSRSGSNDSMPSPKSPSANTPDAAAAETAALREGPLLPVSFAVFCQALYAMAVIAVLYVWLVAEVETPAWLALTSGLAVAATAYGVLTRAWWLALFGQLFMLVSGAQFVLQLSQYKPTWLLALAPITALGMLSFGTVAWFRQAPDSSQGAKMPLLEVARVYRWVGLVMSIWWVCAYIPERERIWVLSLLGLCVFLWAGWKRNREALLFSAAFSLSALALFWLPLFQAPTIYAPNLLAILVLLVQRQIAKGLPERYALAPAVHGAVIIVGGLSLWLFLTRGLLESDNRAYLTPSWSALALAFFGAGIVLRERVYRWLGLGLLLCALGRVVMVDVWKLETVYRVLSFMALGIVLLVLGFIYNRYQEKIREWL